MPIAESIKSDREAYPLKRDQVRRMIVQWREASPALKPDIADRIISLVKAQFKCRLDDLLDDPDFKKELTPDMVRQMTADAQ